MHSEGHARKALKRQQAFAFSGSTKAETELQALGPTLQRRGFLTQLAQGGLGLGLGSGLMLGPQPIAAAANTPLVAAAADLKFALQELADQYERQSGQALRLVFGSSGNFHAQILQGAPFHLYLSADEDWVFRLAAAGKTEDRGRAYALGRIGLFVAKSSPVQADAELRDLAAALKDGRLKKLAIANPEHAPYGARAQEALQHARLWQALQGKLVLGENVAQATQFAVSGAAQAGIIAQSLALAPAIAERGRFALIDSSWHQVLRQRMVLLKGAPAPARHFYEYLATPAAKQVLLRYGFALPQD